MDGVAVGVDRRDHHLALVVAKHGRLLGRPGPTLDRHLERLAGIVHPERDVAHPIAMESDVGRGRMIRRQRRSQNQANLILLQ
jgi:hypothetical protein